VWGRQGRLQEWTKVARRVKNRCKGTVDEWIKEASRAVQDTSRCTTRVVQSKTPCVHLAPLRRLHTLISYTRHAHTLAAHSPHSSYTLQPAPPAYTRLVARSRSSLQACSIRRAQPRHVAHRPGLTRCMPVCIKGTTIGAGPSQCATSLPTPAEAKKRF
jgi:hypothetical protein